MKETPPVLFIVFNRPDTTRRVFESIREARPAKLYIAADGPRATRDGETGLCNLVRSIALQVDWPCDLKTLYRDENLGCKKAVSQALTWFFRHESEGIVLEDDCLPNADFYGFCGEMLEHYRDDDRIWMITGDNFQNGHWRGNSSYYFSKYPHIWGWATWRRCWSRYDGDISFWRDWKNSPQWKSLFHSRAEECYWKRMFGRSHRSKVNSWAYPWMASIWHAGGLTVTPNKNLVTNIGFGHDATHTFESDSEMSIPSESLGEISYMRAVSLCEEADIYVFDRLFREGFFSLVRRSPKIVWKRINDIVRDSSL